MVFKPLAILSLIIYENWCASYFISLSLVLATTRVDKYSVEFSRSE